MRNLSVAVALALAGCATSLDVGAMHGRTDGTGGSLGGHMGIGSVQRYIVVVDGSVRLDVASEGSRLAVGGSVLGGIPVGRYHALARAGIWHAPLSQLSEKTVVPTFELGAYVPLRADPIDPPSKFGWASRGIIFGIRQDFDAAPTTMLFVGLNLFLLPGY